MKALIPVLCLILISTSVECREKAKSKVKAAEAPHLNLANDLAPDWPSKAEREASLVKPPQETPIASTKERAFSLCIPPTCDMDQARPASGNGLANFTDSMLSAKKKEYGMGLSWSASSRLKLSAEYEKILYEGNNELVSPDVIHARMQWKF